MRRVRSRTGWTVTASSSDQNDLPSAIDGDPHTRWTTGLFQAPGIWFKIDMQQPQLFFSVVLDARNEPPDAPVLFDVYLSNDGNFSTPTKVGQQGAGLTTVDFDSAQLVSKGCCWWSIDEVNAFGRLRSLRFRIALETVTARRVLARRG